MTKMKALILIVALVVAALALPAHAQYVEPTTRTNGTVINAAIWNQDVVANTIALKALVDAAQPLDATLTALAGVTTAADKVIYATASDTFSTMTVTAAARSVLDDTTTGAMLTTLGVSAFVQTLLDDANAAAFYATLGPPSTLADTVTNSTGDLTLNTAGDEIIDGAQSRLFGTTSDPTNEKDISYDTGDGMVQSKILIGRVVHPGTWSVQTTDSSAIANTVSETDFDQLPAAFPANSLKAGRTIMWWATYVASTTGTPTLRIRHKLGSVTISDTAAYTTTAGMTNRILTLSGKMTIRSVGASGTYLADITYGPITINSTGQYISSAGPTSEFGTVGATIDTTVSNVLKDTAQWSAASASNTIKRVALTVAIY